MKKPNQWAGVIFWVVIAAIAAGIFATMFKMKSKAQNRIMAGAIECHDKGGYLLPDSLRTGGVRYNCLGANGIIKLSRNMETSFTGLQISIKGTAKEATDK